MMASNYDICTYLMGKFPSLKNFIKNSYIDVNSEKSIGVFSGSQLRGDGLCIGGVDCTAVMMIPISIKIHWTMNPQECDRIANSIYEGLLLEGDNFVSGGLKIAYIELLDSCPQNIGRDDRGISEAVIRCNFYYYI